MVIMVIHCSEYISLSYFKIMSNFSEPTQIYRFLRTRNMISVSIIIRFTINVFRISISYYIIQPSELLCYFISFPNIFLYFQPIFLNRNLSFMIHRSLKANATDKQRRKDFKVDNLLDIKKKESELSQQSTSGFMTIKFLGYYEKKGNCYFNIIFGHIIGLY